MRVNRVNMNRLLKTIEAVLIVCSAQLGWAADPLDTWTASNSGVTNDLRAVVFAQNKLVAVGANGTIATSPDGNTWAARDSGTGDFLGAIAYGAPGFVAVGYGGTALTSPDGVAWTRHDAGARPLYGVAYGGGRFFAVGGGDTNLAVILSSPDGAKWTVVLSSAMQPDLPQALEGLAYGNGRFVATHYDQYGSGMATSLDGIAWTGTTHAGAGSATCFGNGVFVSVCSYMTRDPISRAQYSRAYVLVSSDGLTWTSPVDIPGYLDAISYGAGGFVAVGGPYGANGSSFDDGVTTLVTSPDGTNWTQRAASPGGLGVTSANGQFFVVGSGGTVSRSGVIGKLGASLSNGQFMGSISGISGQNFTIQTSADMNSWSVLTNVPVTNGLAQFFDPLGGVTSHHFYRARVINQ